MDLGPRVGSSISSLGDTSICTFSPEGLPCRPAISVGPKEWAIIDWERRPSEETGLSFFCPEETARQEGLSLLCLVPHAHQGPLYLTQGLSKLWTALARLLVWASQCKHSWVSLGNAFRPFRDPHMGAFSNNPLCGTPEKLPL